LKYGANVSHLVEEPREHQPGDQQPVPRGLGQYPGVEKAGSAQQRPGAPAAVRRRSCE
jgi:hypothetical protein